MKSKLSALLDGEAEEQEVSNVCEALRRQPGLRDDATTYALIGSCLRGEWDATRDITPQVMSALAAEPVVLAPQRPLWKTLGISLAASVAGALVVATALLAPTKEGPPATYTLARNADQVRNPGLRVLGYPKDGQLREADFREYVIAHEAQSRGSYLGGSSQQIRTVSMTEESAGR